MDPTVGRWWARREAFHRLVIRRMPVRAGAVREVARLARVHAPDALRRALWVRGGRAGARLIRAVRAGARLVSDLLRASLEIWPPISRPTKYGGPVAPSAPSSNQFALVFEAKVRPSSNGAACSRATVRGWFVRSAVEARLMRSVRS
ncbi:MAG: hypothetical protein IPK80_28215 [Nannocystis sp.]|nr:hypothetical protein [Nannocystis sp.]